MINRMLTVEIFPKIMFAIVLAVTAIVLAITAWGTLRRNNWGINLKAGRIHCPRCGERIPSIRKPASHQQAIWGGGTCPKCGCEVDKWGREVGKLEKKESRQNE